MASLLSPISSCNLVYLSTKFSILSLSSCLSCSLSSLCLPSNLLNKLPSGECSNLAFSNKFGLSVKSMRVKYSYLSKSPSASAEIIADCLFKI